MSPVHDAACSLTRAAGPQRGRRARVPRRALGVGRGFTVLELLVVLVIGALLILLAAPAFVAISRAEAERTARAQLGVGLRVTREAALRAGVGRDTAAVFAYEPGRGVTVTPAVFVGRLVDRDANNNDVRRDVFVPDPTAAVVTLPLPWTVRGLAPPGWVDDQWYEPSGGANGSERYDRERPNWVFPETAFYEQQRQQVGGSVRGGSRDGRHRQSFMVRFSGGTGEVAPSSPVEALFVDPQRLTQQPAPNDPLWERPDLAADLGVWARRVLRPDVDLDRDEDAADAQARRELLGDESSHTVLVKGVVALALADESELARGIGGRLDPLSGSVYDIEQSQSQGWFDGRQGVVPRLVAVPGVGPGLAAQADVSRSINRWIEGYRGVRLADFGTRRPADATPAQLFTVEAGTGALRVMSVPRGVLPETSDLPMVGRLDGSIE